VAGKLLLRCGALRLLSDYMGTPDAEHEGRNMRGMGIQAALDAVDRATVRTARR